MRKLEISRPFLLAIFVSITNFEEASSDPQYNDYGGGLQSIILQKAWNFVKEKHKVEGTGSAGYTGSVTPEKKDKINPEDFSKKKIHAILKGRSSRGCHTNRCGSKKSKKKSSSKVKLCNSIICDYLPGGSVNLGVKGSIGIGIGTDGISVNGKIGGGGKATAGVGGENLGLKGQIGGGGSLGGGIKIGPGGIDVDAKLKHAANTKVSGGVGPIGGSIGAKNKLEVGAGTHVGLDGIDAGVGAKHTIGANAGVKAGSFQIAGVNVGNTAKAGAGVSAGLSGVNANVGGGHTATAGATIAGYGAGAKLTVEGAGQTGLDKSGFKANVNGGSKLKTKLGNGGKKKKSKNKYYGSKYRYSQSFEIDFSEEENNSNDDNNSNQCDPCG